MMKFVLAICVAVILSACGPVKPLMCKKVTKVNRCAEGHFRSRPVCILTLDDGRVVKIWDIAIEGQKVCYYEQSWRTGAGWYVIY